MLCCSDGQVRTEFSYSTKHSTERGVWGTLNAQNPLSILAVRLTRDLLYTCARKLEFMILILTVDDFASRSLGRRSLRSCANRLRAWPENCNRCWTKRGDMDKNPNQSNEEDLSARLCETRQALEELRNYQGAQIQLVTSRQVNLRE